jgi:ABC-type multidrug transport system fused ATPase/permease subunit
VAENIAYGKLNATREELVEAARKAHALEFI